LSGLVRPVKLDGDLTIKVNHYLMPSGTNIISL